MVWIIEPNRTLILADKVRARQNLAADASDLFWAFFANAYPSREAYLDRMRFWAETLAEYGDQFINREIGEMMEAATKDPDIGIEVVENELEELREEFDPPYAPDGVGDDEETLVAAIHIHAVHLVRTYRLHDSLLSEDVRALVQKLTSLRARLRNLQGNPNLMDESADLVGPDLALARVDVEIAAQDGDYMRALRLMADNLPKELFAEVRLGDNAPDKERWTFDGIAQRIVNWINALKGNRATDWDAVLATLDQIALGSLHGGESVTDDEGYSWLFIDYDRILKEWIKGSLSLPEIRSIYETREDAAAERRLEVYYFPDGLWQALPKRAREALVSADRAFVSGGAGRSAAILNELRVAVVELLHQRLWEPLIAWAKRPENHAASPFIRSERDRLQGRSPDLDAFEKTLGDTEAGRFLEQVGLDKDGLRFIKQQAVKTLKRLRLARNAAEHEPGHEADPAALRDLYAEAVGVGRKGVLPELTRLLAKAGGEGA